MQEEKTPLGYDEVVDTAVDIVEAAKIVADAAADGITITDVSVLFSLTPKVIEIMRDRKEAVDQLLDLTPEEALEAADEIAARLSVPAEGIFQRVVESFELLARTYGQVKQAQYLAEAWIRWGKSFRKQTTLEPVS